VFRIIIFIIAGFAAVAPNSSGLIKPIQTKPESSMLMPPPAIGMTVPGDIGPADFPARNQVAPEPLALQAIID
jgi:hypothetical protein